MKVFERVTGIFTGAVAATALFATPACSQEARSNVEPTNIAMATTAAASNAASAVEILEDADRAAGQWVYGHPNRLAIAVRVGPETQVPLERIAEALSGDFDEQGVRDVPVFFERGTAGGSTVTFVTDEFVYGPFLLQDSRDQVAPTVSQIRFNGQMTAALN